MSSELTHTTEGSDSPVAMSTTILPTAEPLPGVEAMRVPLASSTRSRTEPALEVVRVEDGESLRGPLLCENLFRTLEPQGSGDCEAWRPASEYPCYDRHNARPHHRPNAHDFARTSSALSSGIYPRTSRA